MKVKFLDFKALFQPFYYRSEINFEFQIWRDISPSHLTSYRGRGKQRICLYNLKCEKCPHCWIATKVTCYITMFEIFCQPEYTQLFIIFLTTGLSEIGRSKNKSGRLRHFVSYYFLSEGIRERSCQSPEKGSICNLHRYSRTSFQRSLLKCWYWNFLKMVSKRNIENFVSVTPARTMKTFLYISEYVYK